MSGKSGRLRVGAAVLGASVVAMLGAAAPAGADEAQATGAPATGKIISATDGYAVALVGRDPTQTSLFNLELANSKKSLELYCIEIKHGHTTKRNMIERPWDQFPDKTTPFHENRQKVSWVLHHGYPVTGAEAITKKLEDKGVQLNDGLDKKEAIAATQAAVWHFSDGVDLNKRDVIKGGDEAAKADVLAVYEYLVGPDNKGIGDAPKTAVELSPEDATGAAGSRIGPFTVSTTGEITDLSSDLPEGAKLTDADGKELAKKDVKDATEIFVDVPEDVEAGNGKLGVEATGKLETGRLFVVENYKKGNEAQSLIVATSEALPKAATAKVRWTESSGETPTETSSSAPTSTSSAVAPAPTSETPVAPQANEGPLAQTGFSAMTPLIIGLVLLGGGAVTLLLVRRRKGNAA